MNKTVLGILVGGVLGLMDGLSAWIDPDARPMIAAIIIGSTVKGVITGAATGLIARRWRSLSLGLASGLIVGWGLSTLAALGQPEHYWQIVLPGMLVGALVGFVTQRYPRASASGARSHMPALIFMAALAGTISVLAQSQPSVPTNPLSPLDVLIGRWEGTSEGQPGKGSVQREYSRVLGSRFVQGRNRSVYPPQEKNAKGETHEDMGMFSFDRARTRIVLRQFHVEGFVNQYILEPPSTPGTLVLTTEAIENTPAGWRARETYSLIGPNELEEVFELAEPGKSFELYSRSRLKRVP